MIWVSKQEPKLESIFDRLLSSQIRFHRSGSGAVPEQFQCRFSAVSTRAKAQLTGRFQSGSGGIRCQLTGSFFLFVFVSIVFFCLDFQSSFGAIYAPFENGSGRQCSFRGGARIKTSNGGEIAWSVSNNLFFFLNKRNI